MEEPAITIRLNGQPRRIPDGSSVTALLASLGFAGQPALVELNGSALFPRDFDRTEFKEGDGVEVIRIVAGG
jgi:thiamine biosynthesis protein ThiS